MRLIIDSSEALPDEVLAKFEADARACGAVFVVEEGVAVSGLQNSILATRAEFVEFMGNHKPKSTVSRAWNILVTRVNQYIRYGKNGFGGSVANVVGMEDLFDENGYMRMNVLRNCLDQDMTRVTEVSSGIVEFFSGFFEWRIAQESDLVPVASEA